MANPQVLPGQALPFGIGGLAADGVTVEPLGAATATIDNYTDGYIGVINPSPVPGVQAWGAVVNRAVPEGTTVTVTVTVNSKSQNGTALPAVTFQVDLVGGPLPPQAATCNVQQGIVSSTWAGATDPGSPTATLI